MPSSGGAAVTAKQHAERFKTKMCKNWEKHGECPYEWRCCFAHGKSELRTKQRNLDDNLTSEDAIRAFQRAARPPPPWANAANPASSAAAPRPPPQPPLPHSARQSLAAAHANACPLNPSASPFAAPAHHHLTPQTASSASSSCAPGGSPYLRSTQHAHLGPGMMRGIINPEDSMDAYRSHTSQRSDDTEETPDAEEEDAADAVVVVDGY